MAQGGKITDPSDAHRAGRFVLAVADDDGGKVAGILAELAQEPASVLRFNLELASIIIGLANRYVGEGWRETLGNALLDIELEHPEANR